MPWDFSELVGLVICCVGLDGHMHATTANYPAHADTVCGVKGLPARMFFTYPPKHTPDAEWCRSCYEQVIRPEIYRRL